MRLIDADALIKWLSEWELQESPGWGVSGFGDEKVASVIRDAVDAVKQMPTIDAVTVVRCKDCAYWANNIRTADGMHGDCLNFSTTGTDFFCAYGERRTDATD